MESDRTIQEVKLLNSENSETNQNNENEGNLSNQKNTKTLNKLIKRMSASWSHTKNKDEAQKFVDEYYEKVTFKKIVDEEILQC